jgi:ubiquitin carboxyl-terminal hydrolase 5/13
LSSYLSKYVQIQERYLESNPHILETAPRDYSADFSTQMSKVAVGILTDRYSEPQPSSSEAKREETPQRYVVAPYMFKQLVGNGHREFSSGRQQDASEYLQYLLDVIGRSERVNLGRLTVGRPGAVATPEYLKYELEKRIQCRVTNQVKYVSGTGNSGNVLELRIPMDEARVVFSNEESKEAKRPRTEDGK